MAELKDFGTVKSWYTAYRQTQINEKKVEDEKNVKVLPDDEDKEMEKKPEPKEKAVDDADGLKAENEKLKAEIEKLKLDVKKKDSETNVEPNADTGEVPLRVGIAQSILDKKKKEKKEVKEENVDKTLRNLHYLSKTIENLDEMPKDDAYAIGMSVAKKKMKDEPPLEKKTITKGHEIAKKLMKKESADYVQTQLRATNYAKKLSSYAAKKGGMDKKAFMKISKQMTKAKTDPELKRIGKEIDSMDTEPRDLVKGSIALQMGPVSFKKMFGDRLTSSDMNQYKKMTPRSMREEILDELKEPFIVIDTAQGNKVVGMASDAKEAQSIISSSERPPMRIKNKKTLKVVKVRKKQMIGRPLKEESLDEVNMKDGTMTSKQLDSLKKSYSTVGNTIAPEKGMALAKMLDRFGEGELRQLVRKDIKFVSTLAVNKLIMKHKYKAKDIHDIRKK